MRLIAISGTTGSPLFFHIVSKTAGFFGKKSY